MFKRCTACGVEKAPQDFYTHTGGRLRTECKVCGSARAGRNARAKPLAHSLRSHKHYLMKLYGLTLEDYYRMLDEQQGLCAICGRTEQKRLAVDHCHATGKVRQLLCTACNTSLGKFQDSPELLRRAADYVERHRLA